MYSVINAADNKIGNEGVSCISTLNQLTWLSVCNCVSDIDSCGVTDKGVQYLTNLTQLVTLVVGMIMHDSAINQLTAKGAECISKMPSIK